MEQNISKIERVAILTRLILGYSPRLDLVGAVRLARELANAIDELRFRNVDLSVLKQEFMTHLPEHLKKRTQFLMIVTEHWPRILREMNKRDVELSSEEWRTCIRNTDKPASTQ